MLVTLFDTQVASLVPATSLELSQEVRLRLIKAAIEQYSNVRPCTFAQEVTGIAKKYFLISTVLPKWVEGFSSIIRIEYPAIAVASLAAGQPQYLNPDEDWNEDFWATTGTIRTRYLYLPNHTPAATEIFRVTHTIPWVWIASSTIVAVTQVAHGFAVGDYLFSTNSGTSYTKATDITIATHIVTIVGSVNAFTAAVLQTDTPQNDFFSICYLAGALCCYTVATKYSEIGDSTLNADAGAHVTKAQEYQTRGDKYMSLYRGQMGLDTELPIKAAGVFVSWSEEGEAWVGHKDQVTHGENV